MWHWHWQQSALAHKLNYCLAWHYKICDIVNLVDLRRKLTSVHVHLFVHRGAMFVVGAVAHALGTSLDDVSLSRRTIQRARATTRTVATAAQKATCSLSVPLLLHWDGKLLPDIAGGPELVDRIAILVTSGQIEQLLAVPKIVRGTGEEQCRACIEALDD